MAGVQRCERSKLLTSRDVGALSAREVSVLGRDGYVLLGSGVVGAVGHEGARLLGPLEERRTLGHAPVGAPGRERRITRRQRLKRECRVGAGAAARLLVCLRLPLHALELPPPPRFVLTHLPSRKFLLVIAARALAIAVVVALPGVRLCLLLHRVLGRALRAELRQRERR
eukprot:3218777-Pleurochrysis_carterae.AAC.1